VGDGSQVRGRVLRPGQPGDHRPRRPDHLRLAGGPVLRCPAVVNEHPAAPSGIAIIGPGEEPCTCSQHYYDSRGVARVYQITLDGGEWKKWRQAPGFWQRYTGMISDDGTIITGAWEGSPDGREWKHDFGLTYIKTGAAA
jgi:hypothetical protein